MSDNTEKEQAPQQELPNPVAEWVRWYLDTSLKQGQTSLIGLFQAFQRGRLAGGAESLQIGMQGVVNNISPLFERGPSSAYARVILEHVGCPREETFVVEGAVRAELMQALFKHLTDHAQELPDCVEALPPDFLVPAPPPA
jgi:hypothetical protein